MNILIPHKWLLEQLETTATPQQIQENLSLCGPSVEQIYDRNGDQVYDIEVTTNRVDSMSVRGIAREATAILKQFDIPATLKPLDIPQPKIHSANELLPLPKISNDPALCNRITCIVLRDVQRTPTPDWMAQRLLQTDQNVHDSVIDITNYITHELGHPIHAFDYDQIMKLGGEIIVTEATKGKKFVTLDGNEFETVGGEIVFVNQAGDIIDLPSIKGTANTSVNENTKNILLFTENSEPTKIRFASMTHAIRTVAAQLAEKNVDPHLAESVLLRGAQLYQDLCNATVASELYDDFPGKRELEPVRISAQAIQKYLGLSIPIENVTTILEDLDCKISIEQEVLIVTPPTFRPDIEIPADVIEEIARIYGYHRLPSVLMDTAIPTEKQNDVHIHMENRIKRFLSDIGWQEVYTYSMVSADIAKQSGYALEEHLKLANPLTDDRVYLRRSLIPSLVEVLEQNPVRKNLSVFELANVYNPSAGDLPHHAMHLTLVSNLEYRKVRGAVEALIQQFFVTNLHISKVGEIISGDRHLGTVAVISENRIAVDIILSELALVANSHPHYQPIPKAAPLYQDLTFTLPASVAIGELINTIKEISPLIKKVELKDRYQQNHTFALTFLDPNNSISTEQVDPIRSELIKKLEQEFDAKLVGAL